MNRPLFAAANAALLVPAMLAQVIPVDTVFLPPAGRTIGNCRISNEGTVVGSYVAQGPAGVLKNSGFILNRGAVTILGDDR